MAIFLDTSNLFEIERFHRMGIIAGVTTNPTILLREGVTGGFLGMQARIKQVALAVHPLPVSVEVTAVEYDQVIQQALAFAGLSDNIVIKITVHGPNGELDNLQIIHELASRHGLKLNVTAMMSAQQCLIAALAGATYVSIFGGRMNNMGYNSCDEIRKLRTVLDMHRLPAQIIAASTREVLNIIEWFEAGAHIVTVVPDLLKGMIVHPYTKETVQQFLRDGAKVEEAFKVGSNGHDKQADAVAMSLKAN